MGLITETNAQYYAGQQAFTNSVSTGPYTWTGDTNLTLSPNPNFKVLKNNNELILTTDYTVSGNSVTLLAAPALADVIVIQLLEDSIWSNYGSYSYISLTDIVNNFMVAYVGMDKLIPRCKRTDVIFHAKRGLQEFSYDTLNSIKKLEVDMPPSLSIPIPQDYINYVRVRYVDSLGVLHPIYPLNGLSTNPTDLPLQSKNGSYIQGNYGENLQAQQSQTEHRWEEADDKRISGAYDDEWSNFGVYTWTWRKNSLGQRYGLDPQLSQSNGWFSINQRTNTFSFSSNLASELLILEYISDGLYADTDTKIPKMIEEAMYMHIAYSILAGRFGIPEYIVQRFKKDKYTQLRNAKIRLSNMKPSEMIQVFRGKSKWLKH